MPIDSRERIGPAVAAVVTTSATSPRTEWIPPPTLDDGQSRVDNYHHPDRYLIAEEEDEE